MKPVIGITTDRNMRDLHWSYMVHEKYVAAVVDGAQGFAVLLPALGPRQPVDDILERVDGLLFTGSPSNVEPHHYGGAPSAPGTLHDPARDATTLPLLRAAVERGIPVLAICRGFQEMNVAFGGTLHQRVDLVDGYGEHREDEAGTLEQQYGPAHAVELVSGGLLQRCSDMRTATVNSLHWQGIDRLAEGLQVEATAPDGLIEAVSVRNASAFALGVQWHPEWQHESNALSRHIFGAFGDACYAYRRSRG